jgi:hypothetical protein
MVSTVTSTTFSQTYKDDFSDSDNYHKILFNTGRALQARELTQLQTIIQKEAERHARFVFKEGAPVHSGGVSINTRFEFAKLNTATYSLPSGYSSLIGETFTGLTSTIKVRIVAIEPAVGSDPATIFVEYINNNSTSGTTTPIRLTPGEVINGDTSGTNLQVQTTNTTLNPAIGRGTRLSVNESVFFTSGHFVFTPKQSIILSKYSEIPTAVVGFIVSETIITAQDESALYDNSNATPNLTAPGADRFKITLTLANQADVDADTTFIPSFDIVDGQIAAAKVAGDESLAIIRDIMAQRTYEESGSYTVKPFIVKTKDGDSDAVLDITIGAGIAYVEGYRYETYAPSIITINRPRTTELINNDVVAAEYGNYILCDTLLGLPQVNTFAPVNLRSAVTHGGSTIGTARIRAIEKYAANYRIYLFDVAMTGANNFSAVRSVGTSATDYANIILVNSVASINDTANNNLFFPLSSVRPSAISDISLTTQRRFAGTTTGSGTIQFTLSAGGETFANSSNWIVVRTDTGVVGTVAISAGGNGTASVTISGLPNSTAVALVAYVNKGAGSVKTKTLTNATATITPEGNNDIQLTKADIYRINAIKDGSVSGNNITNYYVIDNGQRDNFYAEGRLVLRTGYTAPAGDVYVDYDYFVHGASGDFFAVNSYTGQVDYADIPVHRQKNGEIVALRDVLDFRSRQSDTAVDFSSTGAVRIELPANTDLITTDVSYYLGQAYRIGLGRDGNFSATPSAASQYPTYPSIPENTMELYKLFINPYCLYEYDVSLEYVDNRRYTMRDIADLETRMNKIEEITTLNMLELETASLEVLDDAGVNRLKIGLTADNFTDHFQSARNSIEYKASTDAFNRELRPPFVSRSSELVFDAANTTGASLVGDTVYPTYTEEVYIANTSVSDPVPVNAFNLGVTVGHIKMSPSSDIWYADTRVPDKIIDGGIKLDPSNNSLWGDWGFNWSGVKASDLKVGYSESKTKTKGRKTTTVTNKIVSDEIVTTSMNDVILYETSIQYMRNKFIFFKASGLRPNTRYFPFFDGIDISDWVQTGSGKFQYMASLDKTSDLLDPGTKYANSSNFPNVLGGKTAQIFSDSNGVVEGIFFVPNRDDIKLLTGTRQFLLIDISVLDYTSATSYASTEFSAQGTLNHWQETIKSTRKYNIQGTVKTVVRSGGGGDGGGGNWGAYNTGSGYAVGSGIGDMSYSEARAAADRANGDGGHGGGDKVICAAMHKMGLIPDNIYALDVVFGQKVNREDPILGDGYRLWATPVANYILRKTIGARTLRALILPITLAWAKQMAHQLRPEEYKSNYAGKVIMAIGHPICRAIGYMHLLVSPKKAI